MTCNFNALRESKLWCSLGRSEHEQVRERGARVATPAHASRTTVVARCAAGGGGAQSCRDAHDGERLERTAQRRWSGGAQASATRSTFGFGRAAEGRIGAAAQGRSARAGVCYGAVDVAACRAADRGEVWRRYSES